MSDDQQPDHHGVSKPGLGSTTVDASMPLATDPQVHHQDDPIQSPVLIAGIAAAAAALLALIVWLTWVLLRSKRKRRAARDDESGRPKLPPDWMTAVEQFKWVSARAHHSID